MYGLTDAITIQRNCTMAFIDTDMSTAEYVARRCNQIAAPIVSPQATPVCSVRRISVDDMFPRCKSYIIYFVMK
jgi:hypothetical protein